MSSRQRTQTQSSACLSFALPGGRSRRTVRCSSSSAPRSVSVGRCSTVSAARRPRGRRRGRREVRAHARAHADRLADVERLADLVAHDVDAGRVVHAAEVGQPPARSARQRAAVGRAGAPARGGAWARAARARRRASRRSRTGAGRARRRRARRSRRRRARGARPRPRCRATRRAARACAGARAGAAGARARPCTAPAGPASRAPARSNACASTRRSNAALCATSTRPRSSSRELRQRRLGGRRLVDHRLRDPGEALDALRQRAARLDERLPALVQLAAADEHGADLGQLARVAGQPVGLRVDDEELGGAQRRSRCP